MFIFSITSAGTKKTPYRGKYIRCNCKERCFLLLNILFLFLSLTLHAYVSYASNSIDRPVSAYRCRPRAVCYVSCRVHRAETSVGARCTGSRWLWPWPGAAAPPPRPCCCSTMSSTRATRGEATYVSCPRTPLPPWTDVTCQSLTHWIIARTRSL